MIHYDNDKEPYKFKLQDKVYSECFGYGTVIETEAQEPFPVRVKFDNVSTIHSFTAEGGFVLNRTDHIKTNIHLVLKEYYKVGSPVYSPILGAGRVTHITRGTPHPLRVKFDKFQTVFEFSEDGVHCATLGLTKVLKHLGFQKGDKVHSKMLGDGVVVDLVLHSYPVRVIYDDCKMPIYYTKEGRFLDGRKDPDRDITLLERSE
jgi:hypothetical protein